MIRSFLFSFLAFLLVVAMPSLSQAKGTVKVGEVIPHNLNLKDSNGKMHDFSDLTGKKGLVLVFIRSLEWCPYCQKQTIELDKNAKKFADAGYSVVTVSYDTPERMTKFVTTNKPKITLLSDPGSESIRAFGILNQESAKGTMSYGIPYPGVYVVSKDKKVQAEIFKNGYQDRATIKEIMAEIEKANPPPAPVYESLDNMGQDPIVPGEDVIDIPEKITEPVVLPNEGEVSGVDVPETTMPIAVSPETPVSDAVVEEALPSVVEGSSVDPVPEVPASDTPMMEPEGFVLPESDPTVEGSPSGF